VIGVEGSAMKRIAIFALSSVFPYMSVALDARSDFSGNSGIFDIQVTEGVTATPIEASGLVYVPDMKAFLIVSDDTEKKRPYLFLMNTVGGIEGKSAIHGLEKINDMESIVADGGHFYVLSSQSFDKKGMQPSDRKSFARFKRDGGKLVLDKSILLTDLLLSAAREGGNGLWADFIIKSVVEKSIDIEGMTVFKDTLLLGFKNPKMENGAVILAVSDFNEVFERNRLSRKQVSLWRSLPLLDSATGTFCGISDLLYHDNTLYGLATGVILRGEIEEDIGLFWKYAPATTEIRIMRSFKGLKPEGISRYSDHGFLIVFDNGSRKPSQFLAVEDAR
jgi:hypothetical protein